MFFTIENRICDVGDLSASGPRVESHRFKHLSGANDGLSLDVALGDHRLLCEEDLLRRNPNTETAARHHDAVGYLQDLLEIAHALVVLDLGDDLDVLALLPQHL